MEYSEHNVLNGRYNVDPRGTPNCDVEGVWRGRLFSRPDSYCMYDNSGNLTANLNSFMDLAISRGDFDSDYSIETTSVYLMDTIDLPYGFSTFLGVRADYFDYGNDVIGRGATTPTAYTYSDLLWNGHAGLVYAFKDWGNVYFSWSTSSNINGGESGLGR